MFFVTYGLFEVPANIILKLMRPSRWIAIIMFCWGTIMTLMGIISSYRGLLVARFFLGIAEAGFFPGATYLLTIWYKRYEVQSRMAVFYAAASLSGAFSGLLAYAIESMDGISGLGGWQWVCCILNYPNRYHATDNVADLPHRGTSTGRALSRHLEDPAGRPRDSEFSHKAREGVYHQPSCSRDRVWTWQSDEHRQDWHAPHSSGIP